MIIFRYLSREILLNLIAVSSVLLIIIMSGRFIKYLAQAAAGDLSPDLLLQIMALRLPGFLELILPLGLFLGILLGYGRLYLESEMAVLYASGLSQYRLLGYALGPASVVAALVAFFSLYLTPAGTQYMAVLMDEAASRSHIETVSPGRFQVEDNGRVSYAQGVAEDGLLSKVFLAEPSKSDNRLVVVLAESGRKLQQTDGGDFLVLEQGVRYQGQPGVSDFTQVTYEQYGVRLKVNEHRVRTTDVEAMSTQALLERNDPQSLAQLHWRLVLPVLALVVTLIAVPMARVNPRQGRYARLVPSILIYLLYLTLLSSARSQVEDGKAGVEIIWLVNLLFLLFAVNLIFLGHFWSRQFNRLPAFKLRRRRAQA